MPAKSSSYRIRLDKCKPQKEVAIRKAIWIRVCKEIKSLAVEENLDTNAINKLKALTDIFYKIKDDVRMDRVEEKEAAEEKISEPTVELEDLFE